MLFFFLYIAPDDYARVSSTLSFSPGDASEQCLRVELKEDDQNESDEYFIVRIRGNSGDYSNFQAIVNITISGAPTTSGPVNGMF